MDESYEIMKNNYETSFLQMKIFFEKFIQTAFFSFIKPFHIFYHPMGRTLPFDKEQARIITYFLNKCILNYKLQNIWYTQFVKSYDGKYESENILRWENMNEWMKQICYQQKMNLI